VKGFRHCGVACARGEYCEAEELGVGERDDCGARFGLMGSLGGALTRRQIGAFRMADRVVRASQPWLIGGVALGRIADAGEYSRTARRALRRRL